MLGGRIKKKILLPLYLNLSCLLFCRAFPSILPPIRFWLARFPRAWKHITMKDMDAQIQDWYKGLHMQRLDLVGDYAGNELFLLEGDSLLLQCFADPKIKLKGKLCRNFQVFLRLHWLTDTYQRFSITTCRLHSGTLPREPCAKTLQLPSYLLPRFVPKKADLCTAIG